MSPLYSREIEIASQALKDAADMYLSKDTEVVRKENEMGVFDVVSGNDILVEGYVKSKLSDAFPEDSFYCEESGESGDTDRVWVIDPIDGTINYTRHIPIYGCQLALMIGGTPVISVLYLPEYDELFTAEKGCGAYLNGKRLDIRREIPMKDSILSIGDYSRGSRRFREDQVTVMNVLHDRVGRIKMMGSACCDFAFFASGRTDYHMRFVRKLWDFLPGMLLAQEAGAVYDKDLYDSRRLLVMAASESNLREIAEAISENMVWYTGEQ